MTGSPVTLVRAEAPAFWARWTVMHSGSYAGFVEKRGMGSPWYAFDSFHDRISTYPTRKDAVAAVAAAPS